MDLDVSIEILNRIAFSKFDFISQLLEGYLNIIIQEILFSLIACCPTLNVLLENDVKDKQGKYEGVYTFQGISDGMDYWVDADRENVIWYYVSGSSYYWLFGSLANLGTYTANLYSSSNILEKKCPNNEGYVWNWLYSNNGWYATNDVFIKCANEDDFCTTENPCGADQGDCDTLDECQDVLFCGSNNCPDYLGFHSEFDCCYAPTIGDEYFCTSGIPCGLDEGDCDSHDECQTGLGCGSNNCPNSLGFDSEVDCCYSCPGNCGSPNYKGDNYCDDENNNCGCEWDGGDCCGNDVSTQYCSLCECLDPNAAISKQSQRFNQLISNSFNKGKITHENKIQKPRGYSRSNVLPFARENEMLSNANHFRNHPMSYHGIPTHLYHFEGEEELYLSPQVRKKFMKSHIMKRSRAKRNSKQQMANLRKVNGHQITQPKSNCDDKKTTYKNSSIVCNHLASSVEGLIVVLNPNEPEYKTDAVKNNFVGFKTLVHSPYDFPEVEAVGMAVNPNIRSYIGIRGYHSWITEDADGWNPDQKKCASKDDIDLNVFEDYTRKNCVFECQAKEFFDQCGCLPYHYPNFHLAWEGINNTACNFTGLLCLSNVSGKI